MTLNANNVTKSVNASMLSRSTWIKSNGAEHMWYVFKEKHKIINNKNHKTKKNGFKWIYWIHLVPGVGCSALSSQRSAMLAMCGWFSLWRLWPVACHYY